jgi:hypothetical protein
MEQSDHHTPGIVLEPMSTASLSMDWRRSAGGPGTVRRTGRRRLWRRNNQLSGVSRGP